MTKYSLRHKTQDILSSKPFQEKTHLEGESISLSFSVWIYGSKYKEVMYVAYGLLQRTNPIHMLYLLSLLDFFTHLWNKMLSK